jgi:hypothetical protein
MVVLPPSPPFRPLARPQPLNSMYGKGWDGVRPDGKDL